MQTYITVHWIKTQDYENVDISTGHIEEEKSGSWYLSRQT
jgi:hypothetical protein